MKIRGTHRRLAGLVAVTVLAAGIGLAGSTSSATASAPDRAVAAVAAPRAAVPAAAVAVTGTWTVSIDWYCDGTSANVAITFNADGSFTSVSGTNTHPGRWYQVGSTLVWTYSEVANLIYTASVNAGFLSGVNGYATAGGATGCIGGTLTTPAAAAAAARTSRVDPVVPR